MPQNGHPVEYRIVLHRNGPPTGMFDAPGFTLLIQASTPEDAVRQAEQFSHVLSGQFRIVDVHPVNGGSADPAR